MEGNRAPSPEGTTWPDPYRKLQWDVRAAFCHDRTTPKEVLLQPLEQIEQSLQRIQQNRQRLAAGGGSLPRESPIWDAMLERQEPLRRIRERVLSFLKQVADSLSDHADTARAVPQERRRERGNKIFIGHGQSQVWKELKTFLRERLGLECEEFNIQSSAGKTTIDRIKD
jgi:hypothetical protein